MNAMTRGQIDKAVAKYRAMLEKHSPRYEEQDVQAILEDSELPALMLGLFDERLQTLAGTIVRRTVRVDRSLTPREALALTGRSVKLVKDEDEALSRMPRGEEEVIEVIFFYWGKFMSDKCLEKEYARRSLIPDPRAQAAVNAADPEFATKHPNECAWKDAQGQLYQTGYSNPEERSEGELEVSVMTGGYGWGPGRWFAGVRKQKTGSLWRRLFGS